MAKCCQGNLPRCYAIPCRHTRALAVVNGRQFVTPDDVKEVTVHALGHRLTLRPETYLKRTRGDDIVRAVLGDVSVPPTAAIPRYSESQEP